MKHDLFAKQFLTIALIALAELLYVLYGIAIFTDFVHFGISYASIVMRLCLVIVGMVASPVIISHVIQWIDTRSKK